MLWADSESGNFGVRVLAAGMAEIARAAWGHNAIVEFQDFAVGDSAVSFGARSVVRDIMRSDGPIKAKMGQYDIILDSGAGDSFTDIYGLKRLSIIIYARRVAYKLRIPLVLGPQTIGPFRTLVGRWAARSSLRKVEIVIARDRRSAKYAHTLGKSAVGISTDVVFALSQPAPDKQRDVVVNVSGLLWFGDRHVNSAAYRDELVKLVRGLLERGRQVTLLAHVVAAGADDDVYAIRDLKRAVGEDFDTIVPATLDQVRSVLSSANMVIGSRMHACLNALSAGTPAIAWAYSRKFGPLMRDIGWNLVLDLTDPSINPAVDTLALLDSLSQSDLELDVARVQKNARERLMPAVALLQKVGVDAVAN